MLRIASHTLLVVIASLIASVPLRAADKPLRVYFADVEGGQATLFVAPTGQSLLIDTGWPGNDNRDAKRIVALAKDAGVAKIDYVLLTHYHEDHAGGVAQLAAMIPIGEFIDHGPNRETGDPSPVKWYEAYQQELARGHEKHNTLKPGDKLPVKGIESVVVSADGNVIAKPLPEGGLQNHACVGHDHLPEDQTENARSLGTIFTFGKLRILDLGDLTMDKEMELMCPVNKLGHVDVYIVSHHGWKQSGSPALVDGIRPRVAIMDNGAKKGGSPSSWDVIHHSPGLEDLWQLHYSEEGGEAHNVPAALIANPSGPDQGNYLKLTAWRDGRFEVFNSRTGETKKYAAR
jgi:beta-lactamase superfamily II metal-dependent hydrolase